MLNAARRHPRLALALAVIVALFVLFVSYDFTPTYIGALFHHL